MADPNLVVRVRADSDLPEVLDRDQQAVVQAMRARQKAERDLTRLIERGDPLRALERRQQRELDQIEKMAARQLLSEERLQEARTVIAERHARERERLEQRAARVLEEAARAQQKQLDALKGQLGDLRGAVSSLAGTSQQFFGQWTSGAQAIIQAFRSGGPIAVGLAAVTAGVTHLVRAWQEAEEAAKATREAEAQARAAAIESLDAQIDRLRQAVQLQRDYLGGITSEQRQAWDAEAAANAQLADLARERSGAMQQVLQAQKELTAARADAAALAEMGLAPSLSDVRRAEANLASARAEVERLNTAYSEAEARAEAAGRAGRDLVKVSGEAGRQRASAGDSPTAPRRRGPSPEDLAAREEAARLRVLERSQATIRQYTDAAARDLHAYLESVDPFAALDARLEAEVATIRGRIEQLRGMATDPALRGEALAGIELLEQQIGAVQERYLQQRDQLELRALEARQKRISTALRDSMPARDPKDAERWERMGWDAGAQVVSGMAAYFKSNDPMDLFRTVLAIGGGVANLFAPGLGGIIGALGGFFQRGGVPYAFRLPEGRQGLALGPGPTNDAKPAWLHPREVVMPADVVSDTFGGLPEAMRVAAGGPLPQRGGGGVTVVNVQAFDSLDAFRGLTERLAPAAVLRNGYRLNSVEALSARRWMEAARYS